MVCYHRHFSKSKMGRVAWLLPKMSQLLCDYFPKAVMVWVKSGGENGSLILGTGAQVRVE